LLLFIVQSYLLFRGGAQFGKYYSPILLAAVSLALPLPYLYGKQPVAGEQQRNPAAKWVALVLAALAFAYCGKLMHAAFYSVPHPGEYSDVLPQMKALYDRFTGGEQPYYPLPLLGYAPFPVYMPLHWLPLGIPVLMGRDIRWIGFFLVVAASLYYIGKRVRNWSGLISGLLPVTVLYLFVQFSDKDMFVTLETIVAAYYLLLATGLAGRRLPVITAGIICCLLSRYTLVFWLPLFALLLWQYAPRKLSYITWGITSLALLLLYVVPFLAREPSILKQGVAYHNRCAIDDWHGYGNPPVSWTHESAVSFGASLKAVLPGDAAQQVSIVRVMQAVLMLSLVAVGYLYYRNRKDSLSIYRFGLAMLYYFLLFFYLVSPLTYRYYWISVMMLSAVICGEVIDSGISRRQRQG
jgi:hypothetical protein